MKYLLSVFLLSFLTGNLISQTLISGGSVSGTWTQSGSPYQVQAAIMIANGNTLTIEPGVQVEFQGSYKLLVMGQLIAQGTQTDSISFYSSDTTLGWLGIRFEETNTLNDSSKFDFCKFEYGKGVSENNKGGAFFINNFSKVSISNSKFSHCKADYSGGAISTESASITIKNCHFYKNSSLGNGGAICTIGGTPKIINSIFLNNTCSGMEGGAAICALTSNPTIENNIISYNSTNSFGGGISLANSDGSLINNVIKNNSAYYGGGLYLMALGSGIIVDKCLVANNQASNYGGGIYGFKNFITNSIVVNNSAEVGGGAIFFNSSNESVISNTTLSQNIAPQGGGLFCADSDPVIRNSIFWNDSATVSGNEIYLSDENSDPDIYYSNMEGGSEAFGLNSNVFFLGDYQNNIFSDPMFIQPSAGYGSTFNGANSNWGLQNESLCINAGDPIGSYTAQDFIGNSRVVSIIDMGAIENQTGAGIDNKTKNKSLNIYPNPVKDIVYVEFNGQKQTTINVYNISGELIWSKIVSGNLEINTSQFKKGVYILQAKSENTFSMVKMIKE